MDFYFALCIALSVVSGSSPASLRIPRQVWPNSFMEHDHGHFHFPDKPVPGRLDSDEFNNDVLGFPDMMTRPGGMGNIDFGPDFGPGFRPRPTSSGNVQRPGGGSNQIPDFSNNPWLNGINRPSGGNNKRPNGGNTQRPSGGNNNRPTGGNSQRPNNQGSSNNQQRPTTTSTTTPGTTTDRTTPRTFHLAPEGCNCPSTPQFNPVCGSDGNTYKNAGLLNCFRLCGIDVTQRRMGTC